jgi:hypothetical protein
MTMKFAHGSHNNHLCEERSDAAIQKRHAVAFAPPLWIAASLRSS